MEDRILKKINTLYHLTELYKSLENMTDEEYEEISSLADVRNLVNSERMSTFIKPNKEKNKKRNSSFDQFRFEIVMSKLRSAILNHNASDIDSVREIDWLLRYLLISPELFPSVRELGNFLINTTEMHHNTTSTGRDRIVDWYLNAIRELNFEEQNIILFKIAKYIFINIPSNYKEWRNILKKDKGGNKSGRITF